MVALDKEDVRTKKVAPQLFEQEKEAQQQHLFEPEESPRHEYGKREGEDPQHQRIYRERTDPRQHLLGGGRVHSTGTLRARSRRHGERGGGGGGGGEPAVSVS